MTYCLTNGSKLNHELFRACFIANLIVSQFINLYCRTHGNLFSRLSFLVRLSSKSKYLLWPDSPSSIHSLVNFSLHFHRILNSLRLVDGLHTVYTSWNIGREEAILSCFRMSHTHLTDSTFSYRALSSLLLPILPGADPQYLTFFIISHKGKLKT